MLARVTEFRFDLMQVFQWIPPVAGVEMSRKQATAQLRRLSHQRLCTGSASCFSHRWTVRMSRLRYAAISFHESRRSRLGDL